MAEQHPRRSNAANNPIDQRIARDLTHKFRQKLSNCRMNELSSRSSSPAQARDFGTLSPPPNPAAPPSYQSLRNIPLVPTPPSDTRSLRFKNMLNSLSQMPLRWENPGLLDGVLRVIPLQQIQNEAEEESQIFQAEAESLGPGKKAAWGYQDCIVRALLRWFKRSFFTWVNNPACTRCFSPTIAVGMVAPTPDEQARGATQVELYECSVKECRNYERFPRYNDAFVLLQTRKGRCGEWANCFGMLCRALGLKVRWVWNSEDHVWTEVYSEHRKRWVHVDACEEAWDKPRLYTEGWGKKLGYCIAFSADGAMDVTRRYVRYPKYALDRTRAPEAVLLYIMDEIRATRRRDLEKKKKFKLQGEDMREQRELQHYIVSALVSDLVRLNPEDLLNGRAARPDPDAQKARESRQSGSTEWIRQRGEDGHSNPNQPNPRDQHPR